MKTDGQTDATRGSTAQRVLSRKSAPSRQTSLDTTKMTTTDINFGSLSLSLSRRVLVRTQRHTIHTHTHTHSLSRIRKDG